MNLQLGYDIDGNELDDLFTRFKAVAGNKKVPWVRVLLLESAK